MAGDPLHELQASVRRYARHVLPGSHARRCVILDEHQEEIAAVRVPACEGKDAETLAPEVVSGWDFRGHLPRFDGVEYPISGRPLAVLRVLGEASGSVSVEDLRAVWDKFDVSDSTIRGAVADLRKRLEKLWPDWEGDVIEATGNGYSLHIR
jgi:DNA-binding response OmpR family regulator